MGRFSELNANFLAIVLSFGESNMERRSWLRYTVDIWGLCRMNQKWMRILNILLAVSFFTGVILSIDASAAKNIAEVNGKAITEDDLQRSLSQMTENQRKNFLKDKRSRDEAIESLITTELLVQTAEKEKLDQTAEFKAAMDVYRKTLLGNLVAQKKIQPKLSTSAVKDFFNKHKYRYNTNRVHAMQIVVQDEARAKKIFELAKVPGADFQKLAEQYSEDQTAKNSRGDLGWVTGTQLLPVLSQEFFTMTKDEVRGPVKSIYGYHVLKHAGFQSGQDMNYDEVELQVTADLREQLLREYVGSLKTNAKITRTP